MQKNIKKYNVSRETLSYLKLYEKSLHEWQKKFNLVSKSSLEDSWNRHFKDSVQLFELVPERAKLLYDFGSGAGFPGMVLAIIAKTETPYLNIKLVESINKKTLYLKHVAEITNTKVDIINDRIENIKPEKADVITSRALASLKELLDYTHGFFHKETKAIFPKGKKYKEEIDEAKKHWSFNVEIIPSETSNEGVILVVTNLKKKGK